MTNRGRSPMGMGGGAAVGMMPMGMGGGGAVGLDMVQQAAMACIPQGGGGGVGMMGYNPQMQMQMQPQQQMQGGGVGGCGYTPAIWDASGYNGCPIGVDPGMWAQFQQWQGQAGGQMVPQQQAGVGQFVQGQGVGFPYQPWVANPCSLYPRLRGPRCVPLVLENVVLPAAPAGPVGTTGAEVVLTIAPIIPFQADNIVFASDSAGAFQLTRIESNMDQFLLGGGTTGTSSSTGAVRSGGFGLAARLMAENNGGCCCISLGGVILSTLNPLRIGFRNKQAAETLVEGVICGVGFYC